MKVYGNDLEGEIQCLLCKLPNMLIRCRFIETEESDQVNRKIGCRVPLGVAVLQEQFKPLFQPFLPFLILLAPCPPAHVECCVGIEMSGEILGNMEQQGMVFAEVPHHIVPRLIDPVSEVHGKLLQLLMKVGRDRVLILDGEAKQRRQAEIGAVAFFLYFIKAASDMTLRLFIHFSIQVDQAEAGIQIELLDLREEFEDLLLSFRKRIRE